MSALARRVCAGRETAAAFRQRGIASLRIPALCRALRLAPPDANDITFNFQNAP
jgi:hypothetical protein